MDNASALPTSSTDQQQWQKRTFDVLQTADIFTRYARGAFAGPERRVARARQIAEFNSPPYTKIEAVR